MTPNPGVQATVTSGLRPLAPGPDANRWATASPSQENKDAQKHQNDDSRNSRVQYNDADIIVQHPSAR